MAQGVLLDTSVVIDHLRGKIDTAEKAARARMLP